MVKHLQNSERKELVQVAQGVTNTNMHGEHSKGDLILQLFDRIKGKGKGQAQTTRINDLQSQLDAARGEISTLTNKVKELEESQNSHRKNKMM